MRTALATPLAGAHSTPQLPWGLASSSRSIRGGFALSVPATMIAQTTVVESNHRDLRRYFEYSSHGIDVVEDGLQEITFGEYLVERGVVDRFELFRALQLQDRMPGARIGKCIAVLGYATTGRIEQMYAAFTRISTVTLE